MQATPVVIINDALADRYFPGEDPLGKRVAFDDTPDATSVWRTIVGIVGNVRRETLALQEKPSFYAPVFQDMTGQLHVLLRTEQDPNAIIAAVRDRVRALDPSLPLFDVTTLETVVATSVGRERFLLILLTIAAVIALLLASIGILGVVLYSTTRRVREIGIRVALGARSASVSALILRSGLEPVLLGDRRGRVRCVLAGARDVEPSLRYRAFRPSDFRLRHSARSRRGPSLARSPRAGPPTSTRRPPSAPTERG